MKEKPSILLITTDEQHIKTISSFGAAAIRTPNIDRLAEQATVYTNAYSASPVCLPARCTLMTGMYPHNSGCMSNIYGSSLSLSYPNLFTTLKEVGYQSAMHGKCHFIPVPYPATRPDKTQEYEHFAAYYRQLGMDKLDLQDDKNNSLWYYDDYSKDLEKQGMLTEYRDIAHMEKPKGGFGFPGPADMHPDAWVGKKALEHLDTAQADIPRFTWVSFSGPHYPIDAPDEYMKRVNMDLDIPRITREDEWKDRTKLHCNGYFGPGTTEGSGEAAGGAQKEFDEAYWRRWRQRYYANVCLIDDYVGAIIEKARSVWGDDLIVIFTADHGDLMGNHNLWGKNHSLHEDVIRIPLLIWEPGKPAASKEEHVSSVDIFPTILTYAGCAIPDNCDGRPLDEVVRDGGRDYIISLCDNRVALLQDGMKLCINKYERTGKIYYELYDLKRDPHEFENLYADPAYVEKRKQLESTMQKLEKEEVLMSSVFYNGSDRPYWLNFGDGAGLKRALRN